MTVREGLVCMAVILGGFGAARVCADGVPINFSGADVPRISFDGVRVYTSILYDSSFGDIKGSRCSFAGGVIDYSTVSGLRLEHDSLDKLSLRSTDISYPSVFGGTVKSARLDGVGVAGADLYHCGLDGVSCRYGDISGLQLRDCSGRGWEVHNCRLDSLRVTTLTARTSRWERADLGNSSFRSSDLSSGAFVGCDFAGSTLQDCDLSNVHITRSNIAGLWINGVNVERLLREAQR